MNYQITQLNKDDYAEAIDFMNMVFSMDSEPHSFPDLLPVLYKPTEELMECHHVIRIDGRIKALLGIYPSEMIIGDESIKFAQIGGVCAHPYSREQKLMTNLMNFAVDKIKSDGYDLAGLGGNRERYKHFGFERCGTKICFALNKNNFKHNSIANEGLTFELVEKPDPETIRELNRLYKKQPLHINRSDEKFFDICKTWNHKLHIARKENEIVGYIVPSGNKALTELVAVSDRFRIAIIQEFFKEDVELSLNPNDKEFISALGKIAENRWISESGNWQIINHEKVLTALMNLKNRFYKLDHGTAVFEIDNTGTFKITVSESEISCKKIDLKSNNSFNREEFMRLALGPLQPCMVKELTPDLLILEKWFPLTLSISSQDKA
jgi:predicted acetyltransferase